MAVIDRPGIAWLTGASKGIGQALGAALMNRGWRVAGSARDEDALAERAAEAPALHFRGYPLDITNSNAVAETVEQIEREVGPIDLAILSAGTHIPTPAHDFDRDTVAKLIDTNLMGTVNCLAALLPRMRARGAGEIAIVASMTGYRGLPTAAAYGATKAALINLAEALRPELEKEGVSLRLINPGFVDTPLTRKNSFPMPFLTSPEKAAKTIVRGLASRRFEITTPRRMAFVMKLLRLVPNWLFFAVARRITPDAPSGTRDSGGV